MFSFRVCLAVLIIRMSMCTILSVQYLVVEALRGGFLLLLLSPMGVVDFVTVLDVVGDEYRQVEQWQ